MNTEFEIEYCIKQKETPGALLITGKWGCGKTTLIKKIAKKLNDGKEYAVVIISLFGIDSTDTVNKVLKKEILYLKTFKINAKEKRAFENLRVKDKASLWLDALAEYSNKAKGVKALLSVNYYDFINIEKEIVCIKDKNAISKKLVIFFDDFERCDLPKSILLGLINDYSENRGIKTIIIADEEKIQEKAYKEFKEKAICKTIKIKLDYIRIIENIIESYQENISGYKIFLKNNMNIIIKAFFDSDYDNIRIVKNAICDFERVYDAWKAFGKGIDDIPHEMYRFIAASFENKNGNYSYIEGYNICYIIDKAGLIDKHISINSKEYNESIENITKKYKDGTFTFLNSTVGEYIVEGDWDKNCFIEELEKKYTIPEISEIDKFFSSPIWEYDSNTVKPVLEESLQCAYKGELNCDQLMRLFVRLHLLKAIDYSLVESVDYNRIELAFDNRVHKIKNNEINEKSIRIIDSYDNLDEEASSIIKKIKMLDSKMIAWKGYNEMKFILSDEVENWQFARQYKMVDVFDDDLLSAFLKKYNASNNAEKMALSDMICKTDLKNSEYSTKEEISISYNNLIKLKEEIENRIQIESDSMTRCVLEQFKTKLTEKSNEIG